MTRIFVAIATVCLVYGAAGQSVPSKSSRIVTNRSAFLNKVLEHAMVSNSQVRWSVAVVLNNLGHSVIEELRARASETSSTAFRGFLERAIERIEEPFEQPLPEGRVFNMLELFSREKIDADFLGWRASLDLKQVIKVDPLLKSFKREVREMISIALKMGATDRESWISLHESIRELVEEKYRKLLGQFLSRKQVKVVAEFLGNLLRSRCTISLGGERSIFLGGKNVKIETGEHLKVEIVKPKKRGD